MLQVLGKMSKSAPDVRGSCWVLDRGSLGLYRSVCLHPHGPCWQGNFKGNVLSKATDQNISKLRMKFVGKWGLTHLSEIPIMPGFWGMS